MRSCGYLQGKTGEQTEQRGGSRQDPEDAATEELLQQEQPWIKKPHTEKEAASAKATRRKSTEHWVELHGSATWDLVAGIRHAWGVCGQAGRAGGGVVGRRSWKSRTWPARPR